MTHALLCSAIRWSTSDLNQSTTPLTTECDDWVWSVCECCPIQAYFACASWVSIVNTTLFASISNFRIDFLECTCPSVQNVARRGCRVSASVVLSEVSCASRRSRSSVDRRPAPRRARRVSLRAAQAHSPPSLSPSFPSPAPLALLVSASTSTRICRTPSVWERVLRPRGGRLRLEYDSRRCTRTRTSARSVFTRQTVSTAKQSLLAERILDSGSHVMFRSLLLYMYMQRCSALHWGAQVVYLPLSSCRHNLSTSSGRPRFLSFHMYFGATLCTWGVYNYQRSEKRWFFKVQKAPFRWFILQL